MKHKMKCNSCGQVFDMRDLSQVLAHEECNGAPITYATIKQIPHDKGTSIQNPITWSTASWWNLPLT